MSSSSIKTQLTYYRWLCFGFMTSSALIAPQICHNELLAVWAGCIFEKTDFIAVNSQLPQTRLQPSASRRGPEGGLRFYWLAKACMCVCVYVYLSPRAVINCPARSEEATPDRWGRLICVAWSRCQEHKGKSNHMWNSLLILLHLFSSHIFYLQCVCHQCWWYRYFQYRLPRYHK